MDVFFLIQIVNNPLFLPNDMNPQLRNLLEGLLCKGQYNQFIMNIVISNQTLRATDFLQEFSHFFVICFVGLCLLCLSMDVHLCILGLSSNLNFFQCFLQNQTRDWHWRLLQSILGLLVKMGQFLSIYVGASVRTCQRKNLMGAMMILYITQTD